MEIHEKVGYPLVTGTRRIIRGITKLKKKEMVMDRFRKWVLAGVLLACLAAFTACEKEGGAEKAGKSIDKALKDLKKKAD